MSGWEDDEISSVLEMKFPGRDLAKIGFPLQVCGGLILVIAIILHYVGHDGLAWDGVRDGGLMHLVGDGLFFFQMRKQKCL